MVAISNTSENNIDWKPTQQYYLQNMTEAISYLDSLSEMPMTGDLTKEIFAKARIAFKKAEPYGSYLNPEVGHRANGPALPVVTDDSQKILLPVGLQKIEESIYEGEETDRRYREEISLTIGLLKNLENNIKERELNPQRFFIATHQQLMRIVSLSISGFDTPVSQLGLNETMVSLQSLKDVYQKSLQKTIITKDKTLDNTFQKNIDAAIIFISKNTDFETFDRYTFIKDYMNPITRLWVSIRKTAAIWEPVNNKPFNFDAPTFFEDDSFNSEFFTPITNRNASEKHIALGKKLFSEPKLSANGKMACITCHNPEKGWADTKFIRSNYFSIYK